MVLLTRHEESIKAKLCFAFQINQSLHLSFPIHSLHKQFFPHWFLSLFELLLLLPFAKSFPKFSGFPNLENKTCAIHLFHSLLPLPKRIRQGLTTWILFVSLFSLFQKNEGLTAWILLCLPSPLSKNSKWHSLRIFWFFPFPYTKVFKGLTTWEFFCIPIHKVSKV